MAHTLTDDERRKGVKTRVAQKRAAQKALKKAGLTPEILGDGVVVPPATKAEFDQWLREFFNTPAGRELVKVRLIMSDQVLVHCVERAFGKVKQTVDMNHHGLADFSDEQLEKIVGRRQTARPAVMLTLVGKQETAMAHVG